jgi:hypothetical protein
MAKTIRLKESELTRIISTISEQQLLNEKWVLRPWVKIVIGIGKAWGWISGAWSDSRLKKNIRKVGKSKSGINIYEFEYKNKARFGGGTYRGVIAEDVPRKAVTIAENGYKRVDYSKLDVAFERINPRKTIKLSERDLSRTIRRVINERGRSNNPMARGNEEMETRGGGDGNKAQETLNMVKPLMDGLRQMNDDIQSMTPEFRMKNGKNAGWTREKAATSQEFVDLMETIVREIEETGSITPGTTGTINAKKSWFRKFLEWVHGLFYEWEGDPPPTYSSDVRLKENVTKTGVSKSGIPTYTFNYKNDNQLWSGTMAQDLLNMGREDAVTIMENGYYGVNYNMIDVDMVAKN